MRIAVVGSRGISDEEKVHEMIDRYIKDIDTYPRSIVIVSGGAEGVDSFARSFADNHGHDFIRFIPYFKLDRSVEFNVSHFFVRNRQIVDNCDALIAIWDGESAGTRYTIEYANKRNKDVRIFKLEE